MVSATVQLVLTLLVLDGAIAENAYAEFPNIIRFPYGTPTTAFTGFFLAISVPLELPHKNIFLSYYFEANYNLPQNETTYEYPPIVSDRTFGITRRYAYDALEYKIKSHGYPGKECLLRTVCEAAQKSLNHNGVLGDLLPSTSNSESELQDYEAAEKQGLLTGHCKKYINKCSISFLGLMSWVGKAMT